MTPDDSKTENKGFYKAVAESLMGIEKKTSNIPTRRQQLLESLALNISQSLKTTGKVELIFICTHNSRRSHLAQVWAQTAAAWFEIAGISCFSGGTEATAFNLNAVNALRRSGFLITAGAKNQDNPLYYITAGERLPSITAFSKKFSAKSNPQSGFIAVMTCTDADEACPFVPGAWKRVSLPYIDPKSSDGTPRQDEIYLARSIEIATEMVFAFSEVKKRLQK